MNDKLKVYSVIAGILIVVAIYLSSRRSSRDKRYAELLKAYYDANPSEIPARKVEDITTTMPAKLSTTRSGFETTIAPGLVEEINTAVNGMWETVTLNRKVKETVFVKLYALDDWELMYVYRLYNLRYGTPEHAGETLTQAINNEVWVQPAWLGGVRDKLVQRLKNLKML